MKRYLFRIITLVCVKMMIPSFLFAGTVFNANAQKITLVYEQVELHKILEKADFIRFHLQAWKYWWREKSILGYTGRKFRTGFEKDFRSDGNKYEDRESGHYATEGPTGGNFETGAERESAGWRQESASWCQCIYYRNDNRCTDGHEWGIPDWSAG